VYARSRSSPARWLDGRVGEVLRRRTLRDRDETGALEAQGADGLTTRGDTSQHAERQRRRGPGRSLGAGAYNIRVEEAVEADGRRMAMARKVDLDESQYTQRLRNDGEMNGQIPHVDRQRASAAVECNGGFQVDVGWWGERGERRRRRRRDGGAGSGVWVRIVRAKSAHAFIRLERATGGSVHGVAARTGGPRHGPCRSSECVNWPLCACSPPLPSLRSPPASLYSAAQRSAASSAGRRAKRKRPLHGAASGAGIRRRRRRRRRRCRT
jgi:hypothetical protein